MSLEACGLFEGMRAEAREELGRGGAEESFAQGEFIFRAGDPGAWFYILEEGRVRVAGGRQGRVAHIFSEQGDLIGWSSIAGFEACIASAECLSRVRVTRFLKDDLDRILRRFPDSGLEFYRRFSHYLGQRLLDTYGGMQSLQSQHPPRSYEYGG